MKIFPVIAVLAAAAYTGFAARVVCYYANWSRFGNDPFDMDDLDPRLCTHVVYAFFGLDNTGNIKSLDPWNDYGDDWTAGGLKRFIGLRDSNPKAKFMIGVGGYGEGPTKFQTMFRNAKYRENFIKSSLDFLARYGFDGVDIDCIYRDGIVGQPTDKKGLSDLVREMKPLFKEKNYTVGFSTSANSEVFRNSYDIPVLSKNVDFINVMSYDFHGFWDGKTGHVAPLYPRKNETPAEGELNVVSFGFYIPSRPPDTTSTTSTGQEGVIEKHIKAGADPEVLNVGLVAYGRTFSLRDPHNNGLNAPATGPGNEEPLPYRRFCVQDKMGQWKKFGNEEQKAPYAVAGNQWVGYEDKQSLREKVKFAKGKKLGGVTFWTFDQDDFRGNCGAQNYALLRAVNDEFKKA